MIKRGKKNLRERHLCEAAGLGGSLSLSLLSFGVMGTEMRAQLGVHPAILLYCPLQTLCLSTQHIFGPKSYIVSDKPTAEKIEKQRAKVN